MKNRFHFYNRCSVCLFSYFFSFQLEITDDINVGETTELVGEILKNLEVIDLFAAFDVSRKFRSEVQRVIGKKRIEFDELRGRVSAPKVFRLFGKYITRLQIDAEDVRDYPVDSDLYTDLDKLIKVITLHCEPGKLVELKTGSKGRIFSQHTEQLLQQACPFFENIAKLIFESPFEFDRFINMLPLNSLQTLKIKRYKETDNWLRLQEFQNLQHVYIGCVSVDANLTRFFELHPNLKTFYCFLNRNIELIARYVPNIENVGALCEVSIDQIHYFRRLNRLKHITIHSQYWMLLDILDKLPNKSILETLGLNCSVYPVEEENPNEITRLTTIMKKFVNLKCLHLIYLLGVNLKYLSIILMQLNTVTNCTIKHEERPYNSRTYIKVVESLKNLRVLTIMDFDISKELYRDLMETWKKRSLNYPIVISLHPRHYDSSMTDCRCIYDKNVVQFEKNKDENYDLIF